MMQPTTDSTLRQTATFEAYYWEAYNEIVEPHRFDHYLVQRWLPVTEVPDASGSGPARRLGLGPLGFALLKVLRQHCYHNPRTGVTRNEVEVRVADLAEAVGVNTATVYRELERNEALKAFVRLQHQYEATIGQSLPRRCAPRFVVCMDDPIHPLDRERYECLRAQKEQDRLRQEADPKETARYRVKEAASAKSQIANKGNLPKSQIANTAEAKSQIANYAPRTKSQIANPKSQFAIYINKESSLPSGIFTKDSVPPAADSPSQKCVPPPGEAEPLDPLRLLWSVTLALLEERVSVPSLKAHIAPLTLTEIAEGVAHLSSPSAFSRDWLEKRHADTLAEALSEAAGQPLRVAFSTPKKAPNG
jgi:hypothetical protein